MKRTRKKMTMVEAYFVTYRGDILPVFHGTHIGELISCPQIYGYTMEEITEIYRKHNEEMPSEGYAREEILRDLLQNKKYVRARIKQGYLYCQIGVDEKRIYKNIMRLREHLRLVLEPLKFKVIGLRVYVVSENFIIDAFDSHEAQEKLQEKIK